MVGTVVLLTTLILVCAIGFIVIYQKLDKKPTPDIKLTVNVPKQEVKIIESPTQSLRVDGYKSNSDHFITNPMDYINRTETKAHIKWQDTDSQNPGSTTT